MATKKFKTEVTQLLHLMIHSLYSHKEIFLRELISNSSDAMDKLSYLSISDDKYKSLSVDFKIDISFDSDKHILSIADNGIGMSESELIENLGTIANSGTKKFLEQNKESIGKDSNLIGQFGVGFYSSFMVAKQVEVNSLKAGEQRAYSWTSNGNSQYTVKESTRDKAGTTVTLYLNEEGEPFSSRWKIEETIKKYSNHIAFPIFLHYTETPPAVDDKDAPEEEPKKIDKVEQINNASAIWKRPKNGINQEEYTEFFHSILHDTGEPLQTIHTHAEGNLEYSSLFYIPETAPFDLFQPDYRPGVKLYVKRVFITDDSKDLLPTYLRFIRGVIDSEDLPLNVSRELLQKNKILSSIRSASVKKILTELGNTAKSKPDIFTKFVDQYNRLLKEGLYSDFENKETLLKLVRFKSTASEGKYCSLEEYKGRMGSEQKSIYYISGKNSNSLANSPLLEAYKAKDIEVLLFADEIDEIISPTLTEFEGVAIKSINKVDTADELDAEEDKKEKEEKTELIKSLLESIKEVLKDDVKDVVVSSRLSDSPVCIVSGKDDPTAQMQQIMRSMGQAGMFGDSKPILEINPDHTIIKKLNETGDKAVQTELILSLFDQALLIEGMPIKDPIAMSVRMNKLIENSL